MLILARRAGEKIIIGDNIVITYLGINNHGNARFGFDAPKHIQILRKELIERDTDKKYSEETS